MTIGKQIQAARKKAGFTQAQLAKECEVATITIQQYERDKREPKLDMIIKIADALSVPTWQLLGGENADNDTVSFELSDEQLSLISALGLNIEEGYFFDPKSPEADALMEVVLGLTDEQKTTQKMLDAFRKLNIWGQKKAIERVEELTEIPKYKKEPPQD